jgi:hypothetical protein
VVLCVWIMTEILLLAMLKEVLKLLPETETLAGLSYDQNQGGFSSGLLRYLPNQAKRLVT